MSYDILDRKVPVKMHICNYGERLEGISFGELTPSGLVSSEDLFLRAEKSLRVLYDDNDALWIGPPIQHDELLEYYLAISLTDMEDAGCVESDDDAQYVIEILAVSPRSVSEDTLKSALDSCGPDDEECRKEVYCQAESLIRYGKAAHLWQAAGDDRDELFKEAVKRLPKCAGLIGFYLDQPQNRIGEPGWLWVSDEEVLGSRL